MITLKGKYNEAHVFTDNFETEAQGQVIELCNLEVYKNSKIRIMPDGHAGKGCVVGTTMTIEDKVTPNLMGVDINCGVLSICLGKVNIDLKIFDEFISNEIPSGSNVHETFNTKGLFISQIAKELEQLKCKTFDRIRALQSVGTLGGGKMIATVSVNC